MLPLRKETKGCQEKQGRARRGKMEEKQKGLFIVEIRMTVLPPNNDAYAPSVPDRESSVHVSIQTCARGYCTGSPCGALRFGLVFDSLHRMIPKHVLLLTKQDAGGTVATNQHKLSATLRTAFWFRTQAEPWLVLRWLRRRRSC
ncbi:hypothetical protein BHM03_00060700 [Ensete ventricosum]|nr:hypothetical protein BHM03_00060700 [Ensete ventricosum]